MPFRPAAMLPAIALVLAAPASAATYQASLTVTGGLSIKRSHDTLLSCTPGQSWTLTASADMALRANVEVATSPSFVSALARKPVRGARHGKAIGGYSETNFCAPFAPVEQVKPVCRGFAVPGAALSLTTRARKLYLHVAAGPATPHEDGAECATPSVTPKDPDAVISALQWSGAAIVLPLDLRVRSATSLGHGRKLIRRLRIAGACDAAEVSHGKPVVTPLNPLEDGDCIVDGAIDVELKRR